jgi:hypothetical protein
MYYFCSFLAIFGFIASFLLIIITCLIVTDGKGHSLDGSGCTNCFCCFPSGKNLNTNNNQNTNITDKNKNDFACFGKPPSKRIKICLNCSAILG